VVFLTYVLLGIIHGHVDEFGILWFLRGGEDKGGIGCGILRLVFADGCFVRVRES
jgi:hypothetical protein